MVRGLRCTITKIHPFGTVDCVSADGKYAFRVTGLPFLAKSDAGHADNVIL
jgi:hypothetical protein